MWAYCSGSLIPNILLKDRGSPEAAEGTVAHGVGEEWLKTGVRPSHLIGTIERVIEGDGDDQIVYEVEITEEMLEYVRLHVDWCRFLDGDHFTETKVDFSDLTPIPKQKGTADHAACMPQKLVVTDLKYGVGVRVFAKNNTQAVLYAYGFFIEYDWYYDFEEIEIRICQPRLDHFDTWTITREELLQWAEFLKERAHLAWRYGAPRSPSEKACQWCKIKSDCKAHAAWVEKITSDGFDDLDTEIDDELMQDLVDKLDSGGTFAEKLSPINELTLEHKAEIFKRRDAVVKWFEAIGRDLNQLLREGEEVPQWKLVRGKRRRYFASEKKARDVLSFAGLTEDEIAPRELASPAQAEAALVKIGYRRNQLESILGGDLVKRRDAGYVMVPSGDSRPTDDQIADDSFDDLDDL